MTSASRKDRWIVAAAVGAWIVCLWLGGWGFDPNLPQDVVREAIHAAPRRSAQLLLQFVLPVALGVLLFKRVIARRRQPSEAA